MSECENAEIIQLAESTAINSGLGDLAVEVRALRVDSPEFCHIVKSQLLRMISHIQSEQRNRVSHGRILIEHSTKIEVFRRLLEGTATEEGIAFTVRNWRKRNNYALLLLLGLAVKAGWDIYRMAPFK